MRKTTNAIKFCLLRKASFARKTLVVPRNYTFTRKVIVTHKNKYFQKNYNLVRRAINFNKL